MILVLSFANLLKVISNYGSNIKGADQPGFARFLQGEAYVGAGFTNLFAYLLVSRIQDCNKLVPQLLGKSLELEQVRIC